MDPRRIVMVLGLNVGEIGIVGEIRNLGEFGIHGKIEVCIVIMVNDGTWLVFEVMEFADDGVFGIEDDDELGICVFAESMDIGTVESFQYDFSAVQIATNDFSEENKLGQGGFGAVYKGELEDGQKIAVKRLANNFGQGNPLFKNEALLVVKLQHRMEKMENGTPSYMIDLTLKMGSAGSLHNIIRGIHIRLLCVQENITDRLTMGSIVLMLKSLTILLPQPLEPAFLVHSMITDPEMPLPLKL
ncbi:cysteine-rich receptor-like protein kinase 26 [Tanacetum coccineum]